MQRREEQRRAEQIRAEQKRAEQRRAEQIRAEQKRAEQRRAERRRDQKSRAQRRVTQRDKSRTETQRLKPAEFCAMNVEMREPEFAGEARSFIGSAQQQPIARGDCRHAHAAKGAYLAPLTPLTGAAHARNCIRRAREQRRLRGALQARGVYEYVA